MTMRKNNCMVCKRVFAEYYSKGQMYFSKSLSYVQV